jgi:hypothetical protein
VAWRGDACTIPIAALTGELEPTTTTTTVTVTTSTRSLES